MGQRQLELMRQLGWQDVDAYALARALLIGTDAPRLDAARLRQAAEALREVDAVFVPALDGGYALVGLRAG